MIFWFEGAELKGLCSGKVEGGKWFNGLVEDTVIVFVVVGVAVLRDVFGVVGIID